MSSSVCKERIIVSGDDGEHMQQIVVVDAYPERFEDVYKYSTKSPDSIIYLPKYVAKETEDIEQHKILIYLIHLIASIHENNCRAKREDDIIDETTAYIKTIFHFGTDAVTDYIDNARHCEVFEHLTNVLRLYSYNGYHNPHLMENISDILVREPGKMFMIEINI